MEARWIPQGVSLEINRAIRRDGALTCNRCHSAEGILDFRAPGYDDEEIASLQEARM